MILWVPYGSPTTANSSGIQLRGPSREISTPEFQVATREARKRRARSGPRQLLCRVSRRAGI